MSAWFVSCDDPVSTSEIFIEDMSGRGSQKEEKWKQETDLLNACHALVLPYAHFMFTFNLCVSIRVCTCACACVHACDKTGRRKDTI